MKKRTLLLGVLFTLSFGSLLQGQSLTLTETGSFPRLLWESSGLQFSQGRQLWSHSDSGNEPRIYKINRQASPIDSLYLKQAGIWDWEDLAMDAQGNFYIGEFGNNNNDRQDLKIYKIPNPDGVTGDSVEAEILYFSYEDQTAFPPAPAALHYDMEAMVWFEDSLYLFTKNRSDPFDGYTRLYRLPDSPGTYQAELVDSIFLGPGPKELWWVTAADISSDGRLLALLSSDKLWLFSCFEGADFFGGALRQFSLGAISQKEAITFGGGDTLYLSDERFLVIGGKLYQTLLGPYAQDLYVDLGPDKVVTQTAQVLDAGISGVHYLWSTGDTTRQISVGQSGEYWVEVSLHGCLARDSIRLDFSSTAVEPLPEKIDTGLQVEIQPNPFGLSTDIHCILPQAGDVVLEIYDLQGKKVAHLPYRYLPAGEQTFRLSQHNVDFGPGNYLLVISSNGRRVEKRLARY